MAARMVCYGLDIGENHDPRFISFDAITSV